MMKDVNEIERNFIVLSPDKTAFIEQADSTLYERLDQTYADFKGHDLVSCYEFESDWDSWEVHPHGDEVVLLIYGDITFVLKFEIDEVEISLVNQGQYLIVPKGVWHTAKTKTKSKVLFITPGQGTQHRPEG